jgi:hypothetical protein
MILSSCQGMSGQPNQAGQSNSSYIQGCLVGGAVGAGASLVWDYLKSGSSKGSRSTSPTSESLKKAGLIGAAGCAVGLAATAIGKILTEREQQRQDEVFQKAAQAGAEKAERDRLQIEERYRKMPTPATDAARVSREQAKQHEIQTAQTKQSNPESWSDGATKGQAIYIGPKQSPQTGEVVRTAGGKDCVTIKEFVIKDGVETSQDSTACPASDGHWQRIELRSA